jgi:TfoX/Sxy family transcriptional regulator of competence genes
MAQPYLDQLEEKLRGWRLGRLRGVELVCKHFFAGAALYANGRIVASLTPAGLALKLPEETRLELFRKRKAKRLRYFARGPIKKDYAVVLRPTVSNDSELRELLRQSIRFVCPSESRRRRPIRADR